jgi:pyruvate kinase
MKKTKIIATLGPATAEYSTMLKLISAGVNVFRMNFSHGDASFFDKMFINLNKAREKTMEPIAILQDLQGPKIRVAKLERPLQVKRGGEIIISDSLSKSQKNSNRIAIDYKGLYKYVKPGTRILINDGMVSLRVIKVKGTDIICSSANSGEIAGRKGVNLPGVKLPLHSLTKKDIENLKYGLKKDVDIVCLSFVRSAGDILELKKIIAREKKGNPIIIAKIEKPEAVKDIDSILNVTDGIMVARGDLAVEAGFKNIPGMQKKLIKKANELGKLVIVATQMLESMTNNPYPERAEVTDVYNAVIDGADTLMLSGETSVGKYPVKTVMAMADIVKKAETEMLSAGGNNNCAIRADNNSENAISFAASSMPASLKDCEIAVNARQLEDITYMSDYRTRKSVIAVTGGVKLFNQMAIYNSVQPVLIKAPDAEKAGAFLRKKFKNLGKIVYVDYHPEKMIEGRITLINTDMKK